jgi:hypothetical protein
MPIRTTLLQDLSAALGGTIVPSLTASSAASDLFEAYVFTMVLDAARAEGATIVYEDVRGGRPARFVFRTSPGRIFSTDQPYTHAIIRFGGTPDLEAHVGVRVAGRSGVLHECDVVVLFRNEAQVCRQNRVSPRSSKATLTVECKFYTSNVPLGLARGFLGLISDITGENRYYVVNTGSRSSEKLLAHHKRSWEHQIVPGSATISRLQNEFRNAFKNFKARNS